MSERAASSRLAAGPSPRQLIGSLCRCVGGLLLGLALSGLSGCASPSGSGAWSGQGGSIQELHLLVMPAALNFTQPGAPDGFAVRVFASSGGRAKGVSIRSGTLDILAYDGIPSEATLETMKPALVWSYPAASLAPFAISSSLGTGYELALPWQGVRPAGRRLTLVARYTPARGTALLAAPSIIPNSLK